MTKRLAILAALALAGPAAAQDMPLSQILIDGEGWRPVEPSTPVPHAGNTLVAREGREYRVVPEERAVYLVGPGGAKRKVADGIAEPRGLVLWADGGTLVVGDAAGKHLFAFRVDKDGGLSARETYYALRVRSKEASGVASLTLDDAGRLYAATREGVQVLDPTGRLSGVLLAPERAPVTYVLFGGGTERDLLYVTCNGKLYVRKTKARGLQAEK